jgi:hypothetical protein
VKNFPALKAGFSCMAVVFLFLEQGRPTNVLIRIQSVITLSCQQPPVVALVLLYNRQTSTALPVPATGKDSIDRIRFVLPLVARRVTLLQRMVFSFSGFKGRTTGGLIKPPIL